MFKNVQQRVIETIHSLDVTQLSVFWVRSELQLKQASGPFWISLRSRKALKHDQLHPDLTSRKEIQSYGSACTQKHGTETNMALSRCAQGRGTCRGQGCIHQWFPLANQLFKLNLTFHYLSSRVTSEPLLHLLPTHIGISQASNAPYKEFISFTNLTLKITFFFLKL